VEAFVADVRSTRPDETRESLDRGGRRSPALRRPLWGGQN